MVGLRRGWPANTSWIQGAILKKDGGSNHYCRHPPVALAPSQYPPQPSPGQSTQGGGADSPSAHTSHSHSLPLGGSATP